MMEQNFFAVRTGFAPVTSTVTEWHSNWAELTHQNLHNISKVMVKPHRKFTRINTISF